CGSGCGILPNVLFIKRRDAASTLKRGLDFIASPFVGFFGQLFAAQHRIQPRNGANGDGGTSVLNTSS
ncbi:MAG: hypothetical protein ABI210_04290, partial [Abditibacteriaceae bacterium]